MIPFFTFVIGLAVGSIVSIFSLALMGAGRIFEEGDAEDEKVHGGNQ